MEAPNDIKQMTISELDDYVTRRWEVIPTTMEVYLIQRLLKLEEELHET